MPTLSSNIVQRGVASVYDVEEALTRQALYGGDLVTNLLELASVSEARLTEVIAETLGLRAAPSGELPRAEERVRRLVPKELAQRYGFSALDQTEDKLHLVVSEALPADVVSDLEFSLGLVVEQSAASLARIRQAVARDYGVELDQRVARVLARLANEPDPYPSVRPPPHPSAEQPGADVAPAASTTAEGEAPTALEEPARDAREQRQRVSAISAIARGASSAQRLRRRRGPYSAALAEADLLASDSADEVVASFFDFAAQYFEYSALFAVQGDLAEGRDAHGAGAPRSKVVALGVPLDLPSALSRVAHGERYRLARLSASGLDGALLKDLERSPGPAVLLLPVRVRERTVLVLYGDHGDSDVQLEAVGDVISFVPLLAGALERVILKRKGRSMARLPSAPTPEASARRESKLPRPGERANALAGALRQNSSGSLTSAPSLARPVISIGPGRVASAASEAALPSAFANSWSLPPQSRTPIPSSFAPGAPPHTSSPPNAVRPTSRTESETEQAFQLSPLAPESTHQPEPGTRPGMGSTPLVRAVQRSLTPVQMPPPPPQPSAPPPSLHEKSAAEDAADTLPPQPFALVRDDTPRLFNEPEAEAVADDQIEFEAGDVEPAPFAPQSRSLSHSARPLPAPKNTEEQGLPTVIVDSAHDTEELIERLAASDPEAANRLVGIGAAAVPALVGAFPGIITQELRRGPSSSPPKASECGPLLSVLARIGPKAAGVLGVRTNDQSPIVRAWATRLLGEMPCMDAARAVARRFTDSDAEVRRAALAAGRMLQSHAVSTVVLAGALSDMLLDSTLNDSLHHMVVEAIADLREARAIPALASLLATGSAELQRSAHWALVVLARADYEDNAAAWDQWWRVNASRHRIEWLIDALMHESQEIRRAAGDELKSLTKEYFGYYDDLPPRERERAQQRYREWWETKGKLRFSPAAAEAR